LPHFRVRLALFQNRALGFQAFDRWRFVFEALHGGYGRHVEVHFGLHYHPGGAGEFGGQVWVVLADEADGFGAVGVVVYGRGDVREADDVAVLEGLLEGFAAWGWKGEGLVLLGWLWLYLGTGKETDQDDTRRQSCA
jgi:hypothetical protein